MRNRKPKENVNKEKEEKEQKYCCTVCGCEIDKDEYESFDGMCQECWDDQNHMIYTCERCGREIPEEEYETYGGLCEECYGIEIDELDYEDENY